MRGNHMNTVFAINKEKCKSCEFCVNSCPKGLFHIGSYINSHGYRVAEITEPEKCIRCLACGTMCPESAIEIMEG